MNKNQVKVEIDYEDKKIDLQISKQMTLSLLAEKLPETLEVIGIKLPEKFKLEITNKHIRIDPNVSLEHYPIGNGDQLMVVEEEE